MPQRSNLVNPTLQITELKILLIDSKTLVILTGSRVQIQTWRLTSSENSYGYALLHLMTSIIVLGSWFISRGPTV
jgi:hypothetical protein